MEIKMTWEVTVNFNSNNAPVIAGESQPVMGFYKARCTASKFFPFKDGKKPYIELTLSIVESSHDAGEIGNTLRERVNVPHESQDPKNAAWTEKFLKTTLIGLGHDPAQVSQANGAMSLGANAFDGREGYLFYEPYTPGDKSTRSYVTWVNADQYARGCAGTYKVNLRNSQTASIAGPTAAAVPPSGFASQPTITGAAPAAGGFGAPAASPANGVSNALASILGS
jgi:hypothetical protein